MECSGVRITSGRLLFLLAGVNNTGRRMGREGGREEEESKRSRREKE